MHETIALFVEITNQTMYEQLFNHDVINVVLSKYRFVHDYTCCYDQILIGDPNVNIY